MDKIYFAGIAEIAESVRLKKISPVEIVEAHLERIEKLQAQLNAFVHVDAEGARRQARVAEAAVMRGEPLGPLHGVPVSIKSCIDVAGWRCPAGSRMRADYVASSDAVLVSRLRAAGAILIANTNTPEFLMAYETDNSVSGKTSNPWSLAHSSGGSSGGEAAAIAAGCSMGGIGSDGGGSVRVPAHFCGISALKPTPGRIPSTGHFPRGAGAFAWLGVVGPMARSVADVRALFDVVKGPDADDALSSPIYSRRISPGELAGLRVGILETDALGIATAETIAAVRRAGELLAAQGFRVDSMRIKGLERAIELWWFFFGPMIAHLFNGLVAGREEELSPMFQEYLTVARDEERTKQVPHPRTARVRNDIATQLPAKGSGRQNTEGAGEIPSSPATLDEFMAACVERDDVRAKIIHQMRDVPILLSPVCLAPAFRHGEGNWQPGTGYRDTMRHSQWLNLAGFPGATVPMGISTEGLPIGVQIIGRPNEDELVLAVGEALESARGGWEIPLGV
jgi:Asp-tRNA(Asn)/Glu-tRNA(Gln) amidotransferase A subunit family amidase